MATVAITPSVMDLGAFEAIPATVALTSATDGALVPFVQEDQKTLIIVKITAPPPRRSPSKPATVFRVPETT